ncbi:MAG: hypothetical protein Q9192_003546, partial [Flavoplaca navasiana]
TPGRPTTCLGFADLNGISDYNAKSIRGYGHQGPKPIRGFDFTKRFDNNRTSPGYGLEQAHTQKAAILILCLVSAKNQETHPVAGQNLYYIASWLV